MTLEEKLTKQLNPITLAPKKWTRNKEHLYADFIELVALFSNEDGISVAGIIDRFKDYKISLSDNQGTLPEDEDEDEGQVSEADDVLTDQINANTGEQLDQEEQWGRSLVLLVEDRLAHFGDDYPFALSKRTLTLRNDLNDRQKIYIMLLACANLSYFRYLEATLTTDFEGVATEAMKQLLPTRAIVKGFGKNSEYEGTAQEKIRNLAKDMKIAVFPNEIERIDGNQERGLDVVSWLPFDDHIPNLISVFGQCACGKDWPSKQNETRRFDSSYFRFYRRKPIHALFVPYCLKRDEGIFYQSDEIQEDTLVIDRKRLLELLSDTAFFSASNSKVVVDRCLVTEEDIV